MSELTFEGVVPIFRVEDLDASLDYYTTRLGFTLQWRGPGSFASIKRGRCELFLCEGGQGHAGGWMWVGVSDAQAAHDDLRSRGAKIRNPPTNYPWALEMQVEDLDGNVLRMGSEPLDGQPYGEFLDMNGVRWPMASDPHDSSS